MSVQRTTVVNLRRREPYDVYVGRAGRGKSGIFGNPVIAGRPCPVCGCEHKRPGSTLRCFRAYFDARIARDPAFLAAVEALRGCRLACFCRPVKGFQGRLLCHAQVIAGYLDGVPPEQVP